MFCGCNIAYSQYHDESEKSNYRLGVGPYLGYKAGFNIVDVRQDIKNGISAANLPDFGVQFYMPFEGQSKMGLIFSGAYITYPYKITIETTGSSTDYKYNYSYIGLGADFFLSGFTAGINIGFPSSANVETGGDLNTNLISNMFEFKIGGHFPILEDEMGRFNLLIQAGYFITGQYNDDSGFYSKNTNPVSFMLGVSYLFNADDKQE
jgi:hypothetical protein